MTIRAWAVVCADGKIHDADSGLCVFTDKTSAIGQAGFCDDLLLVDPCGPHRVISLRGEVSLLGRKA